MIRGLPLRVARIYNNHVLLFAHTGITLGMAWGADKLRSRGVISLEEGRSRLASSRTGVITRLVDFRLALVGSMLPDIIDKPIGIYIFTGTFSNGRIYAHTLLFFLVLFLIGLFRYIRAGGIGMLVLAICSGFHLVLDQMWLEPKTLLWPLFGLNFPRGDMENWLEHILHALVAEPSVYVPELVGFLILAAFGIALIRSRSVFMFLRRGVARWQTLMS